MEIIKGFRDFSGEEAEKRQNIKDILIRNFRLFGFEAVENPIIEEENFVKGDNSNDEAVSDIFKLEDKGKRKLALRYELTFQLKRLAQNKKLPYKRYEIGSVFRDEPVSSNRLRQFTQADIDIVGSSLKEEAEILALTSKILKELGIKFVINFNNRKLLNEILDKEGIRDKENVIREIDKLDKLSEQEIKNSLKKYKAEKILSIFKQKEDYFQKYESYKEILELKKLCMLYKININFSPSLARGLSYYNGSVFEVKSDIKDTITAGGSYLINNIQSTGISFGLERISSLAKISDSKNKILVISIGEDENSLKIINKLRDLNISSEIMFGKISKSLEYANSKKIDFVIFIGEEEVKKKKYKLRNMKTGKEEFLSETELFKKWVK